MATEEFVFKYNYNYYVYRKDSSGEYVIRLMPNDNDDYLHICNDGVSYSELLEDRDSWKIRDEYKKCWVFPHADVSNIFEGNCAWRFTLCYYDSSFEDDKVFTRWEDLVPWVMKLVLLSSNIRILVEYLGVFHNDHGRVEFTDHSVYRQFLGDMVDELLLGWGM